MLDNSYLFTLIIKKPDELWDKGSSTLYIYIAGEGWSDHREEDFKMRDIRPTVSEKKLSQTDLYIILYYFLC